MLFNLESSGGHQGRCEHGRVDGRREKMKKKHQVVLNASVLPSEPYERLFTSLPERRIPINDLSAVCQGNSLSVLIGHNKVS